jgi:PAS domain S-box-containing protein
MNLPATAKTWTQPLTGWEEPKAAAWKIENRAPQVQDIVPFFPDQNSKVYEQLLYNLPIRLHCMDGMGRFTSANKHWTDTFGYSRSEIEGKLFADFLTPESRQTLIQKIYPDYFVSGFCRDAELIMFRKDGTLANIVLSMNGYKGSRGHMERSICILHDVTPRKIAETASRRSEQRFRGAFETAAHGMAIISPAGRVVSANPAFKEMLGRPASDYDTCGFEEFLHGEDRGQFLYGMKRLLVGDVPMLRQELRFSKGNGGTLPCGTSVSIVRDEKKEIDQLVIQIVDVSSKKQTEAQLHHVQKMDAIGQLTGGLAHDFNNLLTIILGNLQLIELAVKGDEKASKRADEAISAAQKGSELTRQLLAFARRQPLEPREVQVNELVRSMAPLVSRTIGEMVELKVETMDGAPYSIIDPSQLESAILNLAINARDAMEGRGKLVIETQAAFLDESYAARYPEVAPGHYVLVAISDTGSGIPAELLEKVFQPFFTTKGQGKGNGLGLSMVYGFIKQSGGHINVYSEVGVGTSIKMYLPRKALDGETMPEIAPVVPAAAQGAVPSLPPFVPAASVEPEAPAAPMEAPPKGLAKILVVEDQEAVRAVACGFLTAFGYDVIEAEDGFQALAKLQEHSDIDLMFSDVVMPGGMNGFDLAQAAYTIRPELRVVHTSGYPKGAMVHQDEPRFREGFIIMKPYRREDLQRIIQDALAKQG